MSFPVDATKSWVEKVVVGFNFCPFAKREVLKNSIRYVETDAKTTSAVLSELKSELKKIEKNEQIETTLLILSSGFSKFDDYLDLLDAAEKLIEELQLVGEFQLASFHPHYCFADADFNDPANYTNRSPFPMLHILREQSLEKAIAHHADPASIPQQNIDKATELGRETLHNVLLQCLESKDSKH